MGHTFRMVSSKSLTLIPLGNETTVLHEKQDTGQSTVGTRPQTQCSVQYRIIMCCTFVWKLATKSNNDHKSRQICCWFCITICRNFVVVFFILLLREDINIHTVHFFIQVTPYSFFAELVDLQFDHCSYLPPTRSRISIRVQILNKGNDSDNGRPHGKGRSPRCRNWSIHNDEV